LGIYCQSDDFGKNIALGKFTFFGINFKFGQACGNKLAGIFTVNNGKVAFITEKIRIASQQPVSDMMKCAAHNPAGVGIDQALHAIEHGICGFVGKCRQQYAFGGNTTLQKTGNPVC